MRLPYPKHRWARWADHCRCERKHLRRQPKKPSMERSSTITIFRSSIKVVLITGPGLPSTPKNATPQKKRVPTSAEAPKLLPPSSVWATRLHLGEPHSLNGETSPRPFGRREPWRVVDTKRGATGEVPAWFLRLGGTFLQDVRTSPLEWLCYVN